jgi:integral membrane sensor domain MASE1
MGRREYNKKHVSFSPGHLRNFLQTLRGNLKYLVGLTVLILAYLAWAQFSLWLTPVAQSYVPPVWPPTGIGLAVVIIFGYRYWPGILIGECALTASKRDPIFQRRGSRCTG